MRRIKRLSLAKLRSQVESVDASNLGRFACHWHQLDDPRRGPQAILDAMDKLQGVALTGKSGTRRTPYRVKHYQSSDLDMPLVTGALQWQGVPNSGAKGGKITFLKPEHVPDLAPTSEPLSDDSVPKSKPYLARGGAFFFFKKIFLPTARPLDRTP